MTDHFARCGEKFCAVEKYLFTAGLLVDYVENECFVDYSARYCYPTLGHALFALAKWNGNGDPPGPWIKEKLSERLGPGALQEPQ